MGAEIETDRTFHRLDHFQQCDLVGFASEHVAAMLAANREHQPGSDQRREDLREIRLVNVATGTDMLKSHRAFALMLGQDTGSANRVICRG